MPKLSELQGKDIFGLIECHDNESRRIQKYVNTLYWLNQFGFSSIPVLERLHLTSRRGLIKELETEGLVARYPSGGREIRHLIGLTKGGIDFLGRYSQAEIFPLFDLGRKRVKNLHHDLLVQDVTFKLQYSYRPLSFESELRKRERLGSPSNVKLPDVTMHFQSGVVGLIEVEEAGKWNRDLHDFLLRCHDFLEAETDDFLAIYTTKDHLKRRYEPYVKGISTIQIYAKDWAGRYRISEEFLFSVNGVADRSNVFLLHDYMYLPLPIPVPNLFDDEKECRASLNRDDDF